jgi:hypothetical protein
MTEIRKNVTEATPLMAMVGATDLAVERVRAVAANADHWQEQWQGEVEKRFAALEEVPAHLQARVKKLDTKAVQQVPALAVARALEAAGKVEAEYEKLAERGKELVDRIGDQKATQELIHSGKVTISRTRAAVTTARKAVDETAHAAANVVHVGRRQAEKAVDEVGAEVAESVAATEKVVAQRGRTTRTAVKGATTAARKRAVGTRTATKRATTSVRKTAAKAVEAVEAAAEMVGDEAPEAPKPAE